MAADNQVIIEIVLDDGTVQRGFAKIQNEGDKAAKGLGQSLTSAFTNITSPTDILAGLFLVRQGLVAVGEAAKKAFDFVLIGEQVKTINAQFQFLSQQANVAGGVFQESISKAADGLADTTDLLQIANQSFVKLGDGAQRLPEIVRLARQIGAVFGGDLAQNVDVLSSAIASGSQKTLKQLGLAVDVNNVYKEQAKLLGLTVDQLTQEEKQRALLNATIEKSKTSYAGVDVTLNQVGDSFKRLQNSAKDAFEATAVLATDVFGPAFKATFDLIAAGFQGVARDINARFNPGFDGATARVAKLTEELEYFQSILAKPNLNNWNLQTQQSKDRVEALKEELRLATIQVDAFNGSISDPRQIVRSLDEQANSILSLIKRQELAQQERLKKQNEYNQASNQLEQQRVQAQLQIAQTLEDPLQAQLIKRQAIQDQIVLSEEQYLARIAEINTRFTDALGFNDEQRNNLRLETQRIYLAQSVLLEQQLASERERIQNESAGRIQVNLKTIGTAVLQAQAAIASSFGATIGQALVRGGDAFANFGSKVLSIVGDLAINLGNYFIAQGFAIDRLRDSLVSLSGGVAIAAGIGLVALGSALKASVGEGAVSAATGTATTTAADISSGVSPGPSTDLTTRTDLERTANTNVVLNIQGDILDGDESALRITKLLNEAFDKQGVQIRRGAFA